MNGPNMIFCMQNRQSLFLLYSCLCFLVFHIACGGIVAPCQADDFDALRARYFQLRNTDPEISKGDEWEALSTNLQNFSHRDSRELLLESGTTCELLYESTGEPRFAECAKRQLQALLSFPVLAPSRAQDAALRLSSVLMQSDAKSALQTLQEVAARFPDSGELALIRRRIQEIRDGQQESPTVVAADRSSVSPVIVIDPGHGGEDHGARGRGGILEKDVTLLVALEMAKLFRASGDQVVLTRRGDDFVPLRARTEIANSSEGSVFLSLHANATPKGDARGFEVYFLDNTGDQSSKQLAERENSAQGDAPSGDLEFIVSDLIQSSKIDDSIRLAHAVLDETVQSVHLQFPAFRAIGVKKAPFYVLVGAHMPCVLIEMFFLDNREDSQMLAHPQFRKTLATGIVAGVRKYLAARQGDSL